MRRIERGVIRTLAVALVWLVAADCTAATVRRNDGRAASRAVADREPDGMRRDLDLRLAVERDGKEAPLATGDDGVLHYAVVEVPAAGQAKVSAAGDFNWTDATSLVLYAKLDAGTTGPVQFIFFFQDVDFWWFQKLLRAEVSSDGTWTKIVVPLMAERADAGTKYAWQSMGHSKPYDRNALRKVRRVGLIVVPGAGRAADAGPARVLLAESHLVTAEPTPQAPRVYGLVSPPSVQRYERFEAAFSLDRTYANPFDPDVVDVRAQITAPSGQTSRVFGFWYQNYRRRIVGNAEQLIPVGTPSWRVRFAPSELGTHTYMIKVRDVSGERTTAPRVFEVLDGPSDGFLHVSKRDHRYLDFDSGRSWFGIGLNLHCPYDRRYVKSVRSGDLILQKERHTLFYDDRLAKFAANGMNWTELWMSSWGFEIEWRGDWRGWAGTGHYHLENAWRLDRVLGQCRDYGIYVNLVMTCHGAYSSGNSSNPNNDQEFQNHAYSMANGGWLRRGSEILTDDRAREAMRKRLRYIVARYGDSTAVACWEMIAESDLVLRSAGGSRADRRARLLRWVFHMAETVRSMDPYDHPITNHYCNTYDNVDPNCARDQRMDLVAGDAYRDGHPPGFRTKGTYYGPMPTTLIEAARHYDQYRKPAIINECGGQWFGGPVPLLKADIHAMNWGGWMTTLATTPQTWWEDFVDEYGLYREYAALARFSAGEDKRGRDFAMHDLLAFDERQQRIPRLNGIALMTSSRGYAWVFDEAYFEFRTTRAPYPVRAGASARREFFHAERETPIRTFPKAFFVLQGLADGTYDLEIWDCYKGAILSTTTVACRGGRLVVALPSFQRDIAVKFRRRPS